MRLLFRVERAALVPRLARPREPFGFDVPDRSRDQSGAQLCMWKSARAQQMAAPRDSGADSMGLSPMPVFQ